jgi:hypothetical protein
MLTKQSPHGGAVQAQQVLASPNMTFFVTSTASGKGADLGGLRAGPHQRHETGILPLSGRSR